MSSIQVTTKRKTIKIKPIAFEDIGVGAVVFVKSKGVVWMTQVTKVTDTCIHGTANTYYKETDKFFIEF